MDKNLELLHRIFNEWADNFTNLEHMKQQVLDVIRRLENDPKYSPGPEASDAQCILVSILREYA